MPPPSGGAHQTLGRLSSPKGTIMLRDVRRVEAATDNKKTEKALNAPTGASFNIVTDKRTYKVCRLFCAFFVFYFGSSDEGE